MPSLPRVSVPGAALVAALLTAGLLAAFAPPSVALAQDAEMIARGEYIFQASGGCSCHTNQAEDGAFMAGNRPIKTPFGVIYSTNITPDPETGIGGWNDEDFIRAMRQGISPEGRHYYPVFPYTAFAGMTERDLLSLKAYLDTIEPVRLETRENELWPPFSWRFTLGPWKDMYFEPTRFQQDRTQSPEWNRGAYLVRHVAHCGECHTPRTFTGSLREDMVMAGSAQGPEGELAPNITPHEGTGIGDWSEGDLAYLLSFGFKPDGDDVQGLMARVIEDGYAHISDEDRRAMATYILSLPPIENRVE